MKQKIDRYKSLRMFHFADFLKARPKRVRNVVIFGNFGVYNSGDEAILAGQIAEVSRLKDVLITIVTRNPENTKKLHNTGAIPLHNPYRLLKQIVRSDTILIGGGGLLAKNDNGVRSLLYQFYFWTMSLLIPSFIGKPIIVTGIGMYRNAHPTVQRFVLRLLTRVQLVTVRDHHSYEFLRNRGVSSHLFKDNSFLMKLDRRKAQQLLKKLNFRKKRKQIAIALKRPDTVKKQQQLIQATAAFIGSHRHEADFWFYALDNNPVYPSDKTFSEEIIQLAEKNSKIPAVCRFIPSNIHPSILFATFHWMDFVIAMRFHAAIFSYRTKRSFVGIAYDAKCTSFINAVGKVAYSPDRVTFATLQNAYAQL